MIEQESYLPGVLAGEGPAVERFLQELESLALTIARRQYRFSREESEDLLIAVFEKLWQNDRRALRQWSGRGPLRAYLSVVINSFCLMQVRRQKRQSREVGTDALDAFPAEASHLPGEQEQTRAAFENALARLSDRDRRLIQMRYLEERDYSGIVSVTGGTNGAARKAVHTALNRLRQEMRRVAPELFPRRAPGEPG